jgi:hypothetical protein
MNQARKTPDDAWQEGVTAFQARARTGATKTGDIADPRSGERA